eukprot:5005837-Pyramimonas_sp.AAC.1
MPGRVSHRRTRCSRQSLRRTASSQTARKPEISLQRAKLGNIDTVPPRRARAPIAKWHAVAPEAATGAAIPKSSTTDTGSAGGGNTLRATASLFVDKHRKQTKSSSP